MVLLRHLSIRSTQSSKPFIYDIETLALKVTMFRVESNLRRLPVTVANVDNKTYLSDIKEMFQNRI